MADKKKVAFATLKKSRRFEKDFLSISFKPLHPVALRSNQQYYTWQAGKPPAFE